MIEVRQIYSEYYIRKLFKGPNLEKVSNITKCQVVRKGEKGVSNNVLGSLMKREIKGMVDFKIDFPIGL